MAKKREPEKPIQYESDSGEEGDSSSEEASSDSEPDLTQITKMPSSSTPAAAQKPKPLSTSKPHQPPPPESESESESEAEADSEYESESDSDLPDSKLKSIATEKPTNRSEKPKSKPSSEDPVPLAKSGKRPAEEKAKDVKGVKRSKKIVEPEKTPTSDSARSRRVWSDEDQIVILQGLIDYATIKNNDPSADVNAFHDFIKKNLHVEATKTQLQDKIRKFRLKYENNNVKEKEGKPITFAKPHDEKIYELSKSFWGNETLKAAIRGEKVIGTPKAKGTTSRNQATKRTKSGDAAAAADTSRNLATKSSDAAAADTSRKILATKNGDAAAADTSRNLATKSGDAAAEKEEPKAVNGDVLSTKGSIMVCGSMDDRFLIAGDKLFEDDKGDDDDEERKHWSKMKMEEMEIYVRNMELKTSMAKAVIKRLKSDGRWY